MPPHVGPDGPLPRAGGPPQGAAARLDLERELQACQMRLAEVEDLIRLTDKEKNGAHSAFAATVRLLLLPAFQHFFLMPDEAIETAAAKERAIEEFRLNMSP